MKKFLTIGVIIAIASLSLGALLYSQGTDTTTSENISITVDKPNYTADFTNLMEFSNSYDQLGNVLADNSVLSTGTYYQARRSENRATTGERIKILTINYMNGGIQTQGVSCIPYRDFYNNELWYINNNAYSRSFYTLRYELSGEDPTTARITRKELVNREKMIEEYYEYEYDEQGRVVEMTRYAVSPYKEEFRKYESVVYHYPAEDGSTDPNSFLYYDVMDKDGSLKFTYSLPPTYFTNNSDANVSAVNEIFVQYNKGTSKSAITLGTDEDGATGLLISFDPNDIQFVIATQVDSSTPGRDMTSQKLSLVFNGDGSLRQVINNSATEG